MDPSHNATKAFSHKVRSMDLLARLFDIARRRRRKIVLPEGEDARIVEAARHLKNENLAEPILLGASAIDGIATADPRNDMRTKGYADAVTAARGTLTPAMAARLVAKPLYFGGMMVRQGDADAMVAGCANPTRRVIEAGLMTVGLAEGIALPSSCFLIIVPDLDRKSVV